MRSGGRMASAPPVNKLVLIDKRFIISLVKCNQSTCLISPPLARGMPVCGLANFET
ncbi:hypothetical protein MYVALT_F_00390 [Candidatus Vallotia tarda]|uniref:Uncharacterized protein n=1 Tax=Candidatus Vallotiella hemipterorum TaxID=1177213 RepID=A0A916NKY1_9BURK|nr:hypothetical protein MYVALT_F_00390 [Candidatus Vallotia tarda]